MYTIFVQHDANQNVIAAEYLETTPLIDVVLNPGWSKHSDHHTESAASTARQKLLAHSELAEFKSKEGPTKKGTNDVQKGRGKLVDKPAAAN